MADRPFLVLIPGVVQPHGCRAPDEQAAIRDACDFLGLPAAPAGTRAEPFDHLEARP